MADNRFLNEIEEEEKAQGEGANPISANSANVKAAKRMSKFKSVNQ